jgi:hypothetical protein
LGKLAARLGVTEPDSAHHTSVIAQNLTVKPVLQETPQTLSRGASAGCSATCSGGLRLENSDPAAVSWAVCITAGHTGTRRQEIGEARMSSVRLRAAAVLGACALSLAILPAASASAAVTGSHITSPADPTYVFYDWETETLMLEAEYTISGTTEGTASGTVDIRCYSGTSSAPVALGVEVEHNAFSYTTEFVPSQTCVLRAVPSGDVSSYPPGTPHAFEGPRLVGAELEFEEDVAVTRNIGYALSASTLSAYVQFSAPGECGLQSSKLYDPTTLEPSHELFACDGALYPEDRPAAGLSTRSAIQIDGANAYDPAGAASAASKAANKSLGLEFQAIKRSVSPTTGEVDIEETNPLVKCAPETGYPPTSSSCKEFVTAGVELKRTWRTSEGGRVISMTDVWKSTDGAAHTISALYDHELLSSGSNGAYELPGAGSFSATSSESTPALPSGPGTILYRSNGTEGEGGNGVDPQGAIVYDSAPSQPLQFNTGSSESGYSNFEMPYAHTISAGSPYTLRMTYIQAYGLAQVRSLSEAAIAAYTPAIAIASPTSGATVSEPNITVAGTASDAVGVSSVTVNGQSASLHAGKTWSQALTLTPGANTITATVTNQSGATASASVTVTYTPAQAPVTDAGTTASASVTVTYTPAQSPAVVTPAPQPLPAPPTATLTGPVSASRGVVKFTLACHGVSGQHCNVAVSLTTLEKLLGKRFTGVAAALRHTKQVTLASLTLSIPAGASVTSTLALAALGKQLLARFGSLPAHLTAGLLREGRRVPVISQNVTIKPPPRKHAKH